MINLFEKNVNNDGAQPVHKSDYHAYVDPTNEFDSSTLGRAMWIARHRVGLRRIFIVSTLILAIFTWGYTLISLGYYAIFGLRQDQQLYANLANSSANSAAVLASAPQNLLFESPTLLPSGTDKVDAVLGVTNPNTRWLATFSYSIEIGLPTTTVHQAVVLPGSTTYIGEYGLPSWAQTATPKIDTVRWQRISNHDIPDLTTWLTDRLNFAVKDFSFTPAGGDSTLGAARVRFTFVNQTAYNFRAPHFLVRLLYNGGLTAVLPLAFDSFNSLEEKTVDFRVYASNVTVDAIDVVPLMNIFDPASYNAPSA